MHGVKRTRLSAEALEAKTVKDSRRAEEYAQLSTRLEHLRGEADTSHSTLELTTALLSMNPEYYTIWNYRREILDGIFLDMAEQEKQNVFVDELKLLRKVLRDYPKIYWIWNHRKWCLMNQPWPDWQHELTLISKMLELDSRNFHVWEYRRYCVSQLESFQGLSTGGLAIAELEYTTSAIRHNFSNFSAWHNRTKLYPQILYKIGDSHGSEAQEKARENFLRDELDLIKGAIYTDPDDQSIWLYHRWLLNPRQGNSRLFLLAPVAVQERLQLWESELQMIEELLQEEPGNVFCLLAKFEYTLALVKNSKEVTENLTEAKKSLSQLLSTLKVIDPMRAGVYQSWFRDLEEFTI